MKNFLEKIMSFELDCTLEQFVRRFFELHGAEMEKTPRGLEVLLPGELAQRLETPDYIHIQTGLEAAGEHAVNYGSPLLEKVVDAACETAPLLNCQLNFDYLKRQGFDKLIRKQFTFNGYVGQVESAATVRTEYLLLTCRYLAQSDEQKEGLVTLIFNLETGALVADMDRMLETVHKDYPADIPPASWGDDKIRDIMKWVGRQTQTALSREIEPFQDSMNRRFRRDVTNLEEYYAGLKQEMEAGLNRPGLSAQLIQDRKEKISLLPDELEKKKDDLFKKYSIKVKVQLCGAVLIRTPAVKVLYRVSVGRQKKRLAMIYNPVTKLMDPLVCQGCGAGTFSVRFCGRLHLLCPACGQKCPAC